MKRTILAGIAAVLASTAAVAATVHPGDQSRWSLDFRVRLEQSASPPAEVHLTGDWLSTIAAVRPGEYDAQLQIVDTGFSGDDAKQASPAALDDLRRRLSRPFWATYRADGGLVAIHFFRDVEPNDSNLLQMIATELQLVRPAATRASWTAQERDGAGEYAALYVTTQPGRIAKRKLKYLYADGVAGTPGNIRIAIDRAEATYALAPNGDIGAVDAISRMRMELSPDHKGDLTAVTEIHIANLRTQQAPDLAGSLARALPNVTHSAIVTHKPDPVEALAQADDRLLEGHSTESLLADAYALGKADAALADRLAAMFRRRPEAAMAAVATLAKDGAQPRLTNALGSAGSPAAIEALASVARNADLAENLRVDAINAFVQMQHPTLEAMRVLAPLMDDPNVAVQSAARMLYGSLSRAGRAEHPAEADAMDGVLIARYRNVRETREAAELLAALGNSVGPAVVPVIRNALRDPRAPVRGAATRALRLAPGSAIDELLAATITSDRDPAVRADAIFAARFRRPLPAPIADALLNAASADSVDYVRSNAVAVLRLSPAASPRIAATLARVADHDTNPGIRRQASEAIALTHAETASRP